MSALAQDFGLLALTREQLAQTQPEFGLAPFAECQRRGCVLASWKANAGDASNGALLFICRDPLDLEGQQWFEAVIEQQCPARLLRAQVGEEDFAEYLLRAEEQLRAMDSIEVGVVTAGEPDSGNTLQLSM